MSGVWTLFAELKIFLYSLASLQTDAKGCPCWNNIP